MPAATRTRATTDQTAAFARIAEALADAFPSSTRPKAVPAREPVVPDELAGGAVIATFVGDRSADLAIVVGDPAVLAEAAGTELVSLPDVLRPALEAAAATIGTGLLGEVAEGDAAGLFGDPDAEVYELRVRTTTIAWLAVRLRDAPAATLDADSIGERLGRINEVEMALTVEIGRTRMSVREVLSLTPGAVVELDRSVGAPADVLLNGRLIAQGEIVVVDQDFAVRITRILDGTEAGR
jgi:flagellar motor switch protein FliN/FliY